MRTRTIPHSPASTRRADELSTLREQARELRERVRELACLHAISVVLENREAGLREALQRTVDLLTSSVQHPERACARLVLGEEEWTTRGQRSGLTGIHAPIRVAGRPTGRLELAYLPGSLNAPLPHFLEEEKRLLRIVANRIADIVRIKEAEQQVQSYQDQLRSLASQLATAQEQERRSIAIFLHDRIGQSLVLARLGVQSLRASTGAPAELQHLDALLEETLRDVRSLTFEVSPPVLYELGFGPAIEWLAERMGPPFGLEIRVEKPARELDLSEQTRAVLFRSVRELVSNAGRHASASHVTIRVEQRAGHVVVRVEDDGCGFDEKSALRPDRAEAGFGLFSLREQLHALGGQMQISSAPGRGSQVRLSLPVERAKGVS